MIANNCNHFATALSQRLTGNTIPGWVNRLAYVAQWFPCVLPAFGIQPTTNNDTNSRSFSAFQGEGQTIAGPSQASVNQESQRPSRYVLAKAALARFENQN